MKITGEMRETTENLMEFLDRSPSPGWAVRFLSDKLDEEGYDELIESEGWNLQPGEKFFLKRSGSTLLAGVVGKEDVVDSGFNVLGAHTDSPGLQVKSEGFYEKENYKQVGVEVYGGPILASWTDRDLSLAGEVVLENGGELETVLWKADRELLRVAQLPLHLNRDVNDEGLKLEKEKHLPPIIGLGGEEKFDKGSVREFIAEDLGKSPEEVKDFDLRLYDTQKSSTLGLEEELFVSGKLDNLMMCYCTVKALLETSEVPDKTTVVVLFDNEEVGSNTAKGGASPFLENVLERIGISRGLGREEFIISLENSFILSADGAHAVHPNYPDEYEKDHKVFPNKGPVIKLNANQKYVSKAENTAFFKKLCERADVPNQSYVNRADKPCGSTIGPITSTRTGIRAMDVGPPMVSMHSAREMAGVADPRYVIDVMKEFILSE